MIDFFHNFNFPATYKNERISNILNILIENVGQGHEEENRDLRRSIANDSMCIADFFIIVACSNIRKRTHFTYFKDQISKMEVKIMEEKNRT